MCDRYCVDRCLFAAHVEYLNMPKLKDIFEIRNPQSICIALKKKVIFHKDFLQKSDHFSTLQIGSDY